MERGALQKLYVHIPHRQVVPQNVNELHAGEHQGLNDAIAVMITKAFGSMWAFWILIIWMLGWMTLATVGVWAFKNDPYPFTFLLFLSNLVQLWALPVLAVGQQVLSRKQELQADETFVTTQKSFHDVEQIMNHLDALDSAIVQITQQIITILHLLESKEHE